MKAIPLNELPSSFNFGENVTKDPNPGKTTNNPPDTPLLQGTPISLAKWPAPLYIPQVIIIGTTDDIVLCDIILSPLCVLIPLFAKQAPNFTKDFTSTNIEHS
jgi:hypothetical protein